jgi:hypothetical protein
VGWVVVGPWGEVLSRPCSSDSKEAMVEELELDKTEPAALESMSEVGAPGQTSSNRLPNTPAQDRTVRFVRQNCELSTGCTSTHVLVLQNPRLLKAPSCLCVPIFIAARRRGGDRRKGGVG